MGIQIPVLHSHDLGCNLHRIGVFRHLSNTGILDDPARYPADRHRVTVDKHTNQIMDGNGRTRDSHG